MRLHLNLTKIFCLLSLLPILSFGESPVVARSADCGSTKLQRFGIIVFSPVASQQFAVACREHDVCYDTYGKSKQKCDKAFHNRMLDICARDHNTWVGRPLRWKCNGLADVYYTTVLEYAGDAYDKAQEASKPQLQTGLYWAPDNGGYVLVWRPWGDHWTWCDSPSPQVTQSLQQRFSILGTLPLQQIQQVGATYWSVSCTGDLHP